MVLDFVDVADKIPTPYVQHSVVEDDGHNERENTRETSYLTVTSQEFLANGCNLFE